MRIARCSSKGGTLIEFMFVGIPIMFVLISIFEMSRAMWTYHTLAFAIKEGTRFAIVHGGNCVTAPNACAKTVADVATVISDAGVGLEPGLLNVSLISGC